MATASSSERWMSKSPKGAPVSAAVIVAPVAYAFIGERMNAPIGAGVNGNKFASTSLSVMPEISPTRRASAK